MSARAAIPRPRPVTPRSRVGAAPLPLGVGSITARWLALAGAAGLVLLFGVAQYLRQLSEGLVVTGMRDPGLAGGAAWALYIALDVYFVGVSFAGITVAALIRLLDLERLKPVARMAEVLTVVSLVLAGLVVVADLGQPLRGIVNLFRYARPQSPFFGTFSLVIAGYLFASVVYLYLDGRRDAARLAHIPGRLQRLHGQPEPVRDVHERAERKDAEHDAHVDECLHGDHRRQAQREEGTERIRSVQRDPQSAPCQHAETGEHAARADEPQLFGDHRIDEIGVRLWQIEQLLNAVHQAAPGYPAGPDGDDELPPADDRRGGGHRSGVAAPPARRARTGAMPVPHGDPQHFALAVSVGGRHGEVSTARSGPSRSTRL